VALHCCCCCLYLAIFVHLLASSTTCVSTCPTALSR
jgi:hypothetical protein